MSHRARGLDPDEKAGNVVSDLSGKFKLKDGRCRSRIWRLRCRARWCAERFVRPAQRSDRVRRHVADGRDDFGGGGGGGIKGFFLKAVDPMFRKKGAGALVPIKIGGTKDKPAFGLDVGKVFKRSRSAQGDMAETAKQFEVVKTDEEWRKILTPEQYRCCAATAPSVPGRARSCSEHRAGHVHVRGAAASALFVADRKFESGTGWPSFFAPLEGAVGTTVDDSLFMRRTEVHCSRCGGHLGHVFPDGPPPTGLRYCINGVALNFEPAPDVRSGSRDLARPSVGDSPSSVHQVVEPCCRSRTAAGRRDCRARASTLRRSSRSCSCVPRRAALRLLSRPRAVETPPWMKVTIWCSSPASRNVPWPRQTSITAPESLPKFTRFIILPQREARPVAHAAAAGASRRPRRRSDGAPPPATRARRTAARRRRRRPRRRRSRRTRAAAASRSSTRCSSLRHAGQRARGVVFRLGAGRARRRTSGRTRAPSNTSAKQDGQLTVASRALAIRAAAALGSAAAPQLGQCSEPASASSDDLE